MYSVNSVLISGIHSTPVSQSVSGTEEEGANGPKGDGEKEKGNGGCDDLGDDGESAGIQDITGEKLGDHCPKN